MTRDELTANFQGAVLYYLDAIDEAVRWTDDLSTMCALGFEEVGDPPVEQTIILENSWLPDEVVFPEPTIATLMGYNLADRSSIPTRTQIPPWCNLINTGLAFDCGNQCVLRRRHYGRMDCVG